MGTLSSRELLVLLAMLNAQATASVQPIPKDGEQTARLWATQAEDARQQAKQPSNPKSNPNP